MICRMSWIHAEDDILNHLTVAGEQFGVPVWTELMDDRSSGPISPTGKMRPWHCGIPTASRCGGTSWRSKIASRHFC